MCHWLVTADATAVWCLILINQSELNTTRCMACGLSERGVASLNSWMSRKCNIKVRNASRSHTIGQVLVLPVLQSGLVGHRVTKPKPLEKWTCSVHLLYDCLLTSIQCDVALHWHGGKDGIYLFNCKNNLTRFATTTLSADILVLSQARL